MNKIVFFDIDRTLFDPESFLNNFFERVNAESNVKIQDIKEHYERSKKETGYFIPDTFLSEIVKDYRQINKQKLEEIFWSPELIRKSLYDDSLSIKKLADGVTIGIFSKGDKKFQMSKLTFIKDILKEENIFIFPDKISQIGLVLSKNPDRETEFVDDDLGVLKAIKEKSNSSRLFLIDRESNLEDNVGVKRIKSLEELEDLI